VGNLPSVELQGRGPAGLSYGMGVKKALLAKKLDVALNLTNPFNRVWVNRRSYDTPAFAESQQNRTFQRTYRLSLSYRFGKDQQNRSRKSIRNDDIKSGGGGQ
jgi:hypothetical protein